MLSAQNPMLSAQNPMLSAKNPMLSANSDVGPPMSTDRYQNGPDGQ